VSLLDRALGRLGLQRKSAAKARIVRQFAAAGSSRLLEDLFSGTTSAAGDLRPALRKLRNRSRTMVRDSAIVKRYCALFAENVSGQHGIRCKPAPLTTAGELDKPLRDKIKATWDRWAESEYCTVDGRLGWVELQQTLDRLEPMDGEFLLRIVDGFGPFGIGLQLLDPDQLDETLNVEPMNGGPWIRQGVELDAYGRAVAYHLWDGHPSDNRRGLRRRIPADDVIHGFIPFRPGAARGIPWLHAGILSVNMLEGYIEASLVASRVAASASVSLEGADEDEDRPTDLPVEMEAGKMFMPPAGVKATMLDPKHPTTSFSEFVKANIRLLANAGGVSYTSLSGDLEAVNYSSIRAGLLSERDHYRMLQQRRIRTVHRRVYARWLRMAQLSGALEISASDLMRAERVQWQPRGFPWVDPEKDIEAFRQELALGLNSRTAAASERGRDLETVFEEIDDEQDLAKDYGVDVSGVEPAPKPAAAPTTPPARNGLQVING
jgi:lambda family phage portal protein